MLDLGEWGWWRFRGTWRFLRAWNIVEFHRLMETLQVAMVRRLPLWVINHAVVRAAVMAMGRDKSPDELTYSLMWNATKPNRKVLQDDTGD